MRPGYSVPKSSLPAARQKVMHIMFVKAQRPANRLTHFPRGALAAVGVLIKHRSHQRLKIRNRHPSLPELLCRAYTTAARIGWARFVYVRLGCSMFVDVLRVN